MSCVVDAWVSDAPIQNVGAGEEGMHWYAVYTYPRHEKAVTEQLGAKSVETFLPTFVTLRSRRDRRVRIEEPVIPGYVFTRMRPGQRNAVLSAPGVIRMLSFNGRPAAIEDSEIESIRRCVERGVRLGPHPSLTVGDRVRVRSGVLEGLEGQITRCKDGRRLVIPITLIGQSVAVDIDVELLERIDAGSVMN